MFKSANALSWACSAALMVMTFTACDPKKEDVPEPEQPAYLLQTIRVNNAATDSLVYKDNRITEMWRRDAQGFNSNVKYTYDNNGNVKLGVLSLDNGYQYLDSLAWGATKITRYCEGRYPDRNSPRSHDTIIYNLDASGKLIRTGDPDTLIVFSHRTYRYTTYTFNNNNVTNWLESTYSEGETNPVHTVALTMEYGSYDSPLALYLLKNPLLAHFLSDSYGRYILSYHNVTKITEGNSSITATTTPAEGTNNIGVLTVKHSEDTKVIKYGYIKKP